MGLLAKDREENRKRYPDLAVFVDQMRDVFGQDSVTVVHVGLNDEGHRWIYCKGCKQISQLPAVPVLFAGVEGVSCDYCKAIISLKIVCRVSSKKSRGYKNVAV